MSKDQIYLEVASDFVKFYAIMGHCLRTIMDGEASQQLPLDQVKEQFQKAKEVLMPRLSGNPVVLKKVEDDFGMTLKLLAENANSKLDQAKREETKEESLRLHFYARERSASLSDLVAVFRGL
ncbi:MAG TPA: hypothetical protein VGB26_08980 [Nitrospiria bacterium]|jgi:hypothetical protein